MHTINSADWSKSRHCEYRTYLQTWFICWIREYCRHFITILLWSVCHSKSCYDSKKYRSRTICPSLNGELNVLVEYTTIYCNWTANDHSPKVKYIIWQDLRSLSFKTFVCPYVLLSRLCTPLFWSHKLVDPYLGCIHEQLDNVLWVLSLSKNHEAKILKKKHLNYWRPSWTFGGHLGLKICTF